MGNLFKSRDPHLEKVELMPMEELQIDFEKRGWHAKYLSILKSIDSVDYDIWKAGYVSGMAFGHPLRSIFFPHEEISIKSRIKIIYTELLVISYLAAFKGQLKEDEFLLKLKEFLQFYFKPKRGIQIRKLSIAEEVEYAINQRAIVQHDWYENFWMAHAYNTLLFTDVILWEAYLKTGKKHQPSNVYTSVKTTLSSLVYAPKKQDKKLQLQLNNIFQINDIDSNTLLDEGTKITHVYQEFLFCLLKKEMVDTTVGFWCQSFIMENWMYMNFVQQHIEIGQLNQAFINNARRQISSCKTTLSEYRITSTNTMHYKNELFSIWMNELPFYMGEKPKNILKARMEDIFDFDLLPEAFRNNGKGRKKSTIYE
jgi:hypothetical protein